MGSIISDVLPVVGGIVGSIVPGLGTAAGAAIGGALGGALNASDNGGNILEGAAMGGLTSYAGGALGGALGGAAGGASGDVFGSGAGSILGDTAAMTGGSAALGSAATDIMAQGAGAALGAGAGGSLFGDVGSNLLGQAGGPAGSAATDIMAQAGTTGAGSGGGMFPGLGSPSADIMAQGAPGAAAASASPAGAAGVPGEATNAATAGAGSSSMLGKIGGYIAKNPLQAAELGLAAYEGTQKQPLPSALKQLQTASSQEVQQAQSVISSGGTSAPNWAGQKASIDASLAEEEKNSRESILQTAANSGLSSDSMVVQQQLAQLSANIETQRQQQYAAAQQQNTQNAISVLSGGSSGLATVGSAQMQGSEQSQQLAERLGLAAAGLGTINKTKTTAPDVLAE